MRLGCNMRACLSYRGDQHFSIGSVNWFHQCKVEDCGLCERLYSEVENYAIGGSMATENILIN